MLALDLLAEQKITEAIERVPAEEAHAKALRRLALLKTRVEARYYRKVLGKLSR